MHMHTPGPWIISGAPVYAGFKVIDSGKRSVAAFPSTSTRADGEREANARLIASAPDLLAILQPFIEIWDKGGPDYEERMKLYWGYDNLSKARAAIAKVRGEN